MTYYQKPNKHWLEYTQIYHLSKRNLYTYSISWVFIIDCGDVSSKGATDQMTRNDRPPSFYTFGYAFKTTAAITLIFVFAMWHWAIQKSLQYYIILLLGHLKVSAVIGICGSG
jgi:hypothetical protein